MIFMFVNYDKCRKEIIEYEAKRRLLAPAIKHPIQTKPEALALLKCHSKKFMPFFAFLHRDQYKNSPPQYEIRANLFGRIQ